MFNTKTFQQYQNWLERFLPLKSLVIETFFGRKFLGTNRAKKYLVQGDQIGQIFAYLAIVYFGQLF
jgi:hypothetical protein